jgi:hypothetical protein
MEIIQEIVLDAKVESLCVLESQNDAFELKIQTQMGTSL